MTLVISDADNNQSQKTAFLRFELQNGNAYRTKTALQEISRLYRSGHQFNSEARNNFETAINGIVLIQKQDEKVVRWCLNSLAQLGRRENSSRYVEAALKQYEGNPEITAAGVAALCNMYLGNIDEVEILGRIDPAIRTLAALQNTDPRKLDLTGFKIDIDTADVEVLKLALITVGLNRGIENLFHPRHNNGEIVKELGQYPDPIVVQYSVWAVLENRRLTITELGVPFQSIDDHPPNVQSKLLQLAAEQETDNTNAH